MTADRVAAVPHDALTDQERFATAFQEDRGAVIWTASSPAFSSDGDRRKATDEADLAHVAEIRCGIQYFNTKRVFSDPAIYAGCEWNEVIALVPSLYDSRSDWVYAEKGPGRSWVIVVDDEALRTGRLLFLFVDQFGNALPATQRRLPPGREAIAQSLDHAAAWMSVADFSCWSIVQSIDDVARTFGVEPLERDRRRLDELMREFDDEATATEGWEAEDE